MSAPSGPDISPVVMPLVRLFNTPDLSWSQRAEISEAINQCLVYWHSMKLQAHREIAAAQSQQKAQKLTAAGHMSAMDPLRQRSQQLCQEYEQVSGVDSLRVSDR